MKDVAAWKRDDVVAEHGGFVLPLCRYINHVTCSYLETKRLAVAVSLITAIATCSSEVRVLNTVLQSLMPQ